MLFCRRMKRVIENTVSKIEDIKETYDFKVVLAGLSNVYTHYITTFEEYQLQKYEAASTIFGPNTLKSYLDQYAYLTEKLLKVWSCYVPLNYYKYNPFYMMNNAEHCQLAPDHIQNRSRQCYPLFTLLKVE